MSLKAFDERYPSAGPYLVETERALSPELVGQPLLFPESTTEQLVESAMDTRRRSTLDLILQSMCLCGLQVVWSVQLSNCAPYLMHLGLASTSVSLIMSTMPFAGIVVPPVIGFLIDRNDTSVFKHKIFMLLAVISMAATSFVLARTERLVIALSGSSNTAGVPDSSRNWTMAVSFLLVSMLGVSAVAVQTLSRILIADCTPLQQRESAATWTARMIGVGSVLGQCIAFQLLKSLSGASVTTQYSALCTLASVSVGVGCLVSMIVGSDNVPHKKAIRSSAHNSPTQIFKSISGIRFLSTPIKSICYIQFFNWMAYFPIMYFSTAYIAQLQRHSAAAVPVPNPTDSSPTRTESLLPGTTMLLIQAVMTLAGTIFVPPIVHPHHNRQPTRPNTATTAAISIGIGGVHNEDQAQLATAIPMTDLTSIEERPSTSITDAAQEADLREKLLNPLLSDPTNDKPHHHWTKTIHPVFSHKQILFLSQVLLSLGLITMSLTTRSTTAMAIIALIGIPWSIITWSPYAQIMVHIPQKDPYSNDLDDDDDDDNIVSTGTSALTRQETSREDLAHDGFRTTSHSAGTVLGVYNVSISSAQVVSGVMAWLLTTTATRASTGDVDESDVRWAFVAGIVPCIIAARLTWTSST